jgi:membrane protein DedA with SNARE-associated domain
MITSGVLVVILVSVLGYQHGAELAVPAVFYGGFLAFLLGGPLGYAAGCLIAAIFLVRKEPDDAEPPSEEAVEHGPGIGQPSEDRQ